MRQQQSIHAAFDKQLNQDNHGYEIRLATSIRVVRLLVKQGLAFRGHDESKASLNREIVLSCMIETIKGIIKELNGDYFSLLADESFDVSRKDKMAVVLRYVDRRGFVMERLLDIVHVKNTSALALKGAIVNLLSQHSLSLSCVRGQCYDGASNMQVGELAHLVSDILNVLAASYKRMDDYRESQRKRIQEALEKGELKTGRGLHQELGISRVCDTR
ncbi:uncharacterized protein LOC132644730 [Lycium barbarum]|uniref:uncharacterized protein LOC132644730 n=1 Tax=Lycium barbarum TaxID=112863 RepID=UPI00293E00D8|nr:uncharacterized protein LOC132644730 [Lycium barbarum]